MNYKLKKFLIIIFKIKIKFLLIMLIQVYLIMMILRLFKKGYNNQKKNQTLNFNFKMQTLKIIIYKKIVKMMYNKNL